MDGILFYTYFVNLSHWKESSMKAETALLTTVNCK